MGVGGATWDTAGTLEVGSGNTFDTAGATEDGPEFTFLFDVGWWTFTPADTVKAAISITDPGDVRIRLYQGDTEGTKETVTAADFVDPTTFYLVQAGVTYHLLVGTREFHTTPAAYGVTYATTALVRSPWISTLRDRTDNQLVISNRGYELQETLNGPEFQPTDWFAQWYSQVIDGIRPPGRTPLYGVVEDFGGPPISGAVSCIWSHAFWGDDGGAGAWDGICPPLVPGVANDSLNPIFVSYSLDAEDTDGVEADVGEARINMFSRALYFLPVRDNVEQRGIFNPPTPEAEGYPADATIEWETPTIELVKVEITGDMETRAAGGTVTEGITGSLRDAIRPVGGGDSWSTAWRKGFPGSWDGATGDGLILFTYRDGDPVWTEITGVVSGDDGWEGLADYTTDASPDEVAVVGMEAAFPGGPDVESGDSRNSLADVALRFTLRSPRYRWIYEAPGFIPPRRIGQRSDGLTGGARRVLGGGNTRQSGSRTLGSIL